MRRRRDAYRARSARRTGMLKILFALMLAGCTLETIPSTATDAGDGAPDAPALDAGPDAPPDVQGCARLATWDVLCAPDASPPTRAYACAVAPGPCAQSTDLSQPIVWCCP